MRMMNQGPLLSRRNQPTNRASLETSEKENDISQLKNRVCLCAPTTHAGSFRCRYHIGLRLRQQKAAETRATKLQASSFVAALPTPEPRKPLVGASRLSRMTCSALSSEQGSTEEQSGPLRFLKSVAGRGVSALGLGHSSNETETVSTTGRSGSIYEVKKGDTLTSISKQQGSTINVLRAVNNLNDDTIYPEQKLWIPVIYEIQKGDTLFQIAQRFKTTIGDLLKVNNIKDQNSIKAGDILLLP